MWGMRLCLFGRGCESLWKGEDGGSAERRRTEIKEIQKNLIDRRLEVCLLAHSFGKLLA